ncbi:MAG: potassium channel family protein [Streptosporangiaceae bacterium]
MPEVRHHVCMLFLLARVFRVTHRRHVAILLAVAVACTVGGGCLFAVTDGVPLTTGVYWAITTATTVGYGDVTPHHPASRFIAVLVMLTAIPLLASVFALVTGAAAANGVRRILAMRDRFPAGTYRLVAGLSPAVPAILDELVRVGDPVVLVADVDPAAVPSGVHVVRGDPTAQAVLRQARPQDAQQALITGESDGDVLVVAILLRKEAPDLPVTALVTSRSVRDALAELGVSQTISGPELIAHTLAKSLEAPHAADMLAELVESDQHCLTEFTAGPDTVGKPLSTVRDERSELVLGLVHEGRFQLGVGADPVVAAGDRLLVAEPARGAARPAETAAR